MMNEITEVKQELAQKLEQKRDVIKNTVAKDATDDELEMFLHLAKQYGLDPFQSEIYFWKYGSKDPTIMTSRDGYLKIANQNPAFDGMDSGVIYPGDSFKKTPDGIDHELDIDNMSKTPKGAYAVVYRSDRKIPTRVVVPFKDYKKSNKVWNSYPSAMIQKVAESMALKRAFSVSGLVSKEEIGHSEQNKNTTKLQRENPPLKEKKNNLKIKELYAEVKEVIENNHITKSDAKELMSKLYQTDDITELDEQKVEEYIECLKEEVKDENAEKMITQAQRSKIFAKINELPNDREYYQEQVGIDSLSSDNCTYEEADKLLDYLKLQDIDISDSGVEDAIEVDGEGAA